MKVAIFTHNYPHYQGDMRGAFIEAFVNELQIRGEEVFLLAPNMAVEPKGRIPLGRGWVYYYPWKRLTLRKLLIQFHWFNPWDVCSLVFLILAGYKELIKLIREERPDICLAAWAVPGGFIALLACWWRKMPYAVWCLGTDINRFSGIFSSWLIHLILKKAKIIFVNAESLAKKIKRKYRLESFPLPTRSLTVQLQGIKDDKQKNTTSANLRFIYVGRLEKVKGIDILFKAIEILFRDNFPVYLTVVGDGKLRRSLERQVRKNNWQDWIDFKGQLDAQDVHRELRNSDCLIIPSRNEGMPVVFWEAMQNRLPVIAAAVGDLEYYLNKYPVGKLVVPNSAIHLSRAIKEFMGEEKRYSIAAMEKLNNETGMGRSAEMFLGRVYGHQV